MLRRLTFTLALAITVLPGHAQSSFNEKNSYDITTAFGKHQRAVALSWSHTTQLGKKKKKLGVGYGLRFTSYFGNNQDFITAPARLTSRQTGPQVIFSKTYNESLDTLRFENPQINALNIALYFDYKITNRISVEFNIDAFGFSLGGSQNGQLISTLRPGTLSDQQSAKPTSLNVLLISDNDIGSLNSEFLLRYHVTNQLSVKTGFCFLFTEYTSDQKLIFDNDRFRNKVSMALIGISYKPKKIKV